MAEMRDYSSSFRTLFYEGPHQREVCQLDGVPVKVEEGQVRQFRPDGGREDVGGGRHQLSEYLRREGALVLVALQVEPLGHQLSPSLGGPSNFLEGNFN